MCITFRIIFILLIISALFPILLLSKAEESNKNSNAENIIELRKMFNFIGDTEKISVSVESNYDAPKSSIYSLTNTEWLVWHFNQQ